MSTGPSCIGGVPSMPNISQASLKKLNLEETLLQASYVGIQKLEVLLKDHPNLLAKLQAGIGSIENNFLKILSAKYGVSASTFITTLETVPSQIDALNNQIDSITSQINGLNAQIDGITAQLQAVDGSIDGVSQQLDSVNANIASLSSQIDAINTAAAPLIAVNAQLATLNGQLTDVTNQLTNAQNAVASLDQQKADIIATYGASTLIGSALLAALIAPYALALQAVQTLTQQQSDLQAQIDALTLQQTTLELLYGPSLALLPGLQSQLATANQQALDLQAQLTSLTQQQTDLQTQLATDQSSVTALQLQLAPLQAQLTTDQAKLASATAFIDHLSPIELTLMKELFPSIVLPV